MGLVQALHKEEEMDTARYPLTLYVVTGTVHTVAPCQKLRGLSCTLAERLAKVKQPENHFVRSESN